MVGWVGVAGGRGAGEAPARAGPGDVRRRQHAKLVTVSGPDATSDAVSRWPLAQ